MRASSKRIFALAATLFFATALAFAAAPAPKSTLEPPRGTKLKKHQATGEILAVSSKILILLHARGRSRQRMIFHLSPQTKETVAVFNGRRVTVIYVKENGRLDAVRIRAPKTRKR